MGTTRHITYADFEDAETIPLFGRMCRLVYLIQIPEMQPEDTWLLPEHLIGMFANNTSCLVDITRSKLLKQYESIRQPIGYPHQIICLGIDEDDVGWLMKEKMPIRYQNGNRRKERWQKLNLSIMWPHVRNIFKQGMAEQWACATLSSYLLACGTDIGHETIGLRNTETKSKNSMNVSAFLVSACTLLSQVGLPCYVAYVHDNIDEFVYEALSDGYVVSVGVPTNITLPFGAALPTNENSLEFHTDSPHRFTLFPVANIEKILFLDSYHIGWYDKSDLTYIFNQLKNKKGVTLAMAPSTRLSADNFAKWLYEELQNRNKAELLINPKIPSCKPLGNFKYSKTETLPYTKFSIASTTVPKILLATLSKCYDTLLENGELSKIAVIPGSNHGDTRHKSYHAFRGFRS